MKVDLQHAGAEEYLMPLHILYVCSSVLAPELPNSCVQVLGEHFNLNIFVRLQLPYLPCMFPI